MSLICMEKVRWLVRDALLFSFLKFVFGCKEALFSSVVCENFYEDFCELVLIGAVTFSKLILSCFINVVTHFVGYPNLR